MAVSAPATKIARARTVARVLRGIARTFSLLLLAVLLFDWLEAGPGPFSRTPNHDDIEAWWATAFMVVAGAGLLFAWRWELLGGALAVGSMALFTLIALPSAADSEVATARLFATAVFGLPGALFLLAGLVSHYASRPRGPSSSAVAETPASPSLACRGRWCGRGLRRWASAPTSTRGRTGPR